MKAEITLTGASLADLKAASVDLQMILDLHGWDWLKAQAEPTAGRVTLIMRRDDE